MLTATSDKNNAVQITHLVLDGSSQWIIGRNITSRSTIEQYDQTAPVFVANGERDSIAIIDDSFLSYIALDRFTVTRNQGSALLCLSAVTLDTTRWSDVKKIIGKVHKHVCGHASFTDYKILLGHRNNSVSSYLSKVVNDCTACRSTAVPKPNCEVSISSLSKEFNESLCIDHLYLDGIRLTH